MTVMGLHTKIILILLFATLHVEARKGAKGPKGDPADGVVGPPGPKGEIGDSGFKGDSLIPISNTDGLRSLLFMGYTF